MSETSEVAAPRVRGGPEIMRDPAEYAKRAGWDASQQAREVAALLHAFGRDPALCDAIDWCYRPSLETMEDALNRHVPANYGPGPLEPGDAAWLEREAIHADEQADCWDANAPSPKSTGTALRAKAALYRRVLAALRAPYDQLPVAWEVCPYPRRTGTLVYDRESAVVFAKAGPGCYTVTPLYSAPVPAPPPDDRPTYGELVTVLQRLVEVHTHRFGERLYVRMHSPSSEAAALWERADVLLARILAEAP